MLTHVVFLHFGIESIELNGLERDPKTEEEFNQITYTSETKVTWEQFWNELDSLRRQGALYQLRMMRNEELKNTDWIMTYDNIITLQNKDEWVAYRQYLRDVPTNVTIIYNEHNTLDVAQMNIFQRPPVIRTGPTGTN